MRFRAASVNNIRAFAPISEAALSIEREKDGEREVGRKYKRMGKGDTQEELGD